MNSEVRIAASLVRPFYGRAEKGFPMVFGCNADFLWKGLLSPAIVFWSGPCVGASADGCNFRVARRPESLIVGRLVDKQ
jgi:hypothetical protein